MFNLSDCYEGLAVLNKKGTVQYCNSEFTGLVTDNEINLVGTSIDKWLKPVELNQEICWFCSQTVNSGRLGGLKGVYRYRLEPMECGVVLFICKDRSAQEEELQALYSRAFQLNPGLSAISVIETGEHLDVNRAWLDAMGYKCSEVIGRTASELKVWEYGEKTRLKIVQKLRENGKIRNLEARMRTKDGRLLDIVISAELVKYRGHLLAFFVSHDITKLKQINDHRLSLQMKAESWQRIAFVDDLTGIANRRQFNKMITEEWHRCARQSVPLSLLMLDIDCFKLYNDHYGHQAGDKCLSTVAQALNDQVLRSGDLLCRYGGEEFSCILPDTNTEGALQVATRMLKAVNMLKIPHLNSSTANHITLSIGFSSCIPEMKDQEDSLILSADSNLYKAKSAGRARIEGSGFSAKSLSFVLDLSA